ncbi:putative F-box domain, FBD domain, leucine-rich repeat domain superfamily [Helianthus annuus]|nr:putative F-box domain, FBD domain, leucine-rich repeat domain superfamily [Helianthus annuus]KAJ0642678.1 putative F-box domain, FBD domain, leucine-rich repeat domain superfamily [Helianthus annuus]KAJ0646548.1 putative F-box domain, FBD domain, leucine-rich repeat domain superfamily [Helianthus annuus]KAJ0823260.1 putative F-box domain, FBD domain, leucine-rich repeat domain superfamily [Helianthus annuus]
MENQNPTTTQTLNSDIISSLPLNIIEYILTRMPLRDALRTSVLSKKWRYTWRGMPKLVFTDDMVTMSSNHLCRELKKYKLVYAIFHVLMLHNGPETLVFDCSVGKLHLESDIALIISYLARRTKVKKLFFGSDDRSYKLPVSFFSLQGLECVHLYDCILEPPLTFNGFSSLTIFRIWDVDVSAQKLQQFLSKCPQLVNLRLAGCQKGIDFVAGENKFTFGDLLQCVPLIQTLNISKYYMKYLCAGGMPHKLPTSLAHLKDLFLDVCLVEQNEISSALCIIRSSPVLQKIKFLMSDNEKLPVQQTPSNFLDPEDYPDLKLDYLVTLEIANFSNLPLEMKFVKLIMAKSPLLKNVKIKLNDNVSVDEEMKMLKDMLRLPILRASPCAELIIDRP